MDPMNLEIPTNYTIHGGNWCKKAEVAATNMQRSGRDWRKPQFASKQKGNEPSRARGKSPTNAYGSFLKWGENPVKMGDLGVPLFQETSICSTRSIRKIRTSPTDLFLAFFSSQCRSRKGTRCFNTSNMFTWQSYAYYPFSERPTNKFPRCWPTISIHCSLPSTFCCSWGSACLSLRCMLWVPSFKGNWWLHPPSWKGTSMFCSDQFPSSIAFQFL